MLLNWNPTLIYGQREDINGVQYTLVAYLVSEYILCSRVSEACSPVQNVDLVLKIILV